MSDRVGGSLVWTTGRATREVTGKMMGLETEKMTADVVECYLLACKDHNDFSTERQCYHLLRSVNQ